MHLDLAIEKLRRRYKLDRCRIEKRITMTEIAQEAGVTLSSVSMFLKARLDSDRIEEALKKLGVTN